MKQPPSPEGGGIHLDDRLHRYAGLVRKYHRTLDLVSDAALAELPELVRQARAYADIIHRVAPDGTILDLGSGVGLPGVVIAAALPRRDVVLVERRRRRGTFLAMVVAQLGLDRAHVVQRDVTDMNSSEIASVSPVAGSGRDGVRVVTAQAVARLADVYCLTRHLHDDTVTIVSRKGPSWRDEVASLPAASGASPAVRAAVALPQGGTLVAVESPGGLPCPRSG